MSDIPPLSVKVELQMAQIEAQMNELTAKFRTLGTVAEEQKPKIEGVGHAFKGVGTAMVAFAGFEFLKKSGEVAIKNSKSYALFANGLRKSIGASDELTKSVDDQLVAMEASSNVLTETLRPAFDTLVRSTHNAAQAQALLQTALDVSAAKGKDVGSVASAFAKSLNGQQTALSRLVPEVKNVTDKMGYLTKAYKGSAEAAAATDPYAKLQIAMKNLEESFGMALLPALQGVASMFQIILPIVGQFAPLILGLVAGFVTYKTAMAAMTLVQLAYNGVVALSTIATEGFTLALASTGIGAIAIAVGLLTAGLLGLNAAADAAGGAPSKAALAAGDAAVKKAKAAMGQEKYGAFAFTNVRGVKTEDTLAGIRQAAIDKVTAGEKKLAQDKIDAEKLKLTGGLTGAKAADPIIAYAQATQDKLVAAQKKYQDTVVAAQAKYADDIASKVQDFKDKFAEATNANVGDLFQQGYQSADAMLNALKDKLASTKKFAEDAGKLASAGYSASFIKQVIAQGPVVGDQLAQSLLQSTPETAKQIQDMFQQANDASTTGVNDLATSMTDQFVTSTKALGDALTKAAQMLKDTLTNLDLHFNQKVSSMKGHLGGGAVAIKTTGAAIKSAETVANQQVINITNNNNTNATAQSIAQQTVNSIKFGLPITLTGATQ
jgi:hypothetical protein